MVGTSGATATRRAAVTASARSCPCRTKGRVDEVEVIVADQSAPTAILNAPKVVNCGQRFNLDG
jgi:hypothetical protein